MPSPLPYAPTSGGVLLTVRLTPRSSREAVTGLVRLADGRAALQIRLMAPPVDDAANLALIALLAQRLDMPRSRISLVAGHKARLKTVLLSGEAADIVATLATWLS